MGRDEQHGNGSEGYGRREFLRGAGAAAAGSILLGSGAAAGVEALRVPSAFAAGAIQESDSAHFGRIFGDLPFFGEKMDRDKLAAAMVDIGKPGGILDANDELLPDNEAQAALLITDPSLSANNPNNPTHTAGTHFVGQFFDHDLTFDTTSQLGVPKDPTISPNARTPAFDLDSVYGGGPTASPQLYDRARLKFLVESGGTFEDLPRTSDLTAIIPEPRNDENLIISGLHCAFLLFHNAAVDWVKAHSTGESKEKIFADARRLTTWHYQWMMINEFLPLFVGQAMVNDVLTNSRRFYLPNSNVPFIPVEFQAASYRMGHSMIRPSYRANFTGDNGSPFFAFIFDPTSGSDSSDPIDLSGGHRAPRRFVGWHTFFDFDDGKVKPNKRIDTKISSPLFHLPLRAIPPHAPPTSLPQRTLLRHITWSLPSGQAIAERMGVAALTTSQLHELSHYGLGLEKSTPLFYYVLKEAELTADGLTLGPVGGRVVAEVFIGLLQLDPTSYLSVQPSWTP